MNWIYKANIKQYMNNREETPQSVLMCAKNIRKELTSNPALSHIFGQLPKLLEEETKRAVNAGFEWEECCAVFNTVLDGIYDRADINAVWLGM